MGDVGATEAAAAADRSGAEAVDGSNANEVAIDVNRLYNFINLPASAKLILH